jgi:hypothetical protein
MIKVCSLLNLMVKNQLSHGGKVFNFPMLNFTDKHRGHRGREHGDQIFVADTNLWIRQNISGRGLV